MEQIHLFAETVAAFAVIATFLYLGIQIRDSSRSNRAAAVATLLSQYDSPNSIASSSTANARVFRLGFEGSDELNADEKTQFQLICLQHMTVYHAAYRFHKDGILADEHWNLFRRDLVEWTNYPGMKSQRTYFLAYYAPDPDFAKELQLIFDEDLDAGPQELFLSS